MFRSQGDGVDWDRLRTSLVNSGFQQKSNALFQVVDGLINGVATFQKLTNEKLNDIIEAININETGDVEISIVNNMSEFYSAELATKCQDETGSAGFLVFSLNPTFGSNITVTNNAIVTGKVGIGVGKSSPTAELEVAGQIRAEGDKGAAAANGIGYINTVQANALAANFLLRRARDAAGVASALQSGDSIAALVIQGHDGTAYGPTNNGAIIFNATENYTIAAKGCEIVFSTTTTGTVVRTNRWRVGGTGHFESVNGTEMIKWGTTNTFPALKRNTTIVEARLGDDSAYGAFHGIYKFGQNTITSTGTQNDVSFGNGVGLLICNNATDLTITGLLAGLDGQRLVIMSIGAGHVFMSHQDAGSAAANRLINAVTSGPTPLAAGAGRCEYQYDLANTRWRLISHDQGQYIDIPHASVTYDSDTGAFWTVDLADVATQKILITGRLAQIICTYANTTTIAGVGSRLRADFSGYKPWTWITTTRNWIRANEAGAITNGMATCAAATSRIQFSSAVTDPAWGVGANNRTIDGATIMLGVN